MSPLQVIQGGKDLPGHVCTWCGLKTFSRADLELHWERDVRCRANRDVSNQTQSKYGMADGVEVVAGEETLRRVRAKDCIHPPELRESLKNAERQTIGYRCSHCYTEIYW